MKEAAGNLLLTSLSHIKEEKKNDTFQKIFTYFAYWWNSFIK